MIIPKWYVKARENLPFLHGNVPKLPEVREFLARILM